MPEENEALAPLEGELVPSEAAIAHSAEIGQKMNQLLQQSVMSAQLQDAQMASTAARTATALYATSEASLSRHDALIIKILRNATCLFAPFTRATVCQVEGRFSKAREELKKGLATSNEAIATVEEYSQLPDHDEDIVKVWRPACMVFPILFNAYDAYIHADIVGYEGDIPQYVNLLRKATAEFRRVDELPASMEPMILNLIGICATLAERLETRADVFESKPKRRNLPTGAKIFIIHGHDEAKWRELDDLLTKRLKLETLVLAEEASGGETIIEKFEESAKECGYAFALVTPDDFVKKHDKAYSQARPNVLFEIGWFYGQLGRERVCIIKKVGTEIPSDLAGIVTIEFQKAVSEGIVPIEDELRQIGILK